MDLNQSKSAYNNYLTNHIGNVIRAYGWYLDNNILSGIFSAESIAKAQDLCRKHDESKWSDYEYDAYRQYFDPTDDEVVTNENGQPRGDKAKFNVGWLHHEHNNPHHWEYWVQLDEDHPGQVISLEMPDEYIIEMLCDWMSFSLKQNNPREICNWYDSHKDSILMHTDSKIKVEEVLDRIDKIASNKFESLLQFDYDTLANQVLVDKGYVLNPKLWNPDSTLKPEVAGKINDIVTEFVLELQENEIPISIIDTWLVGSNAAYNYTDNSDLDVHIIANLSEVNCDPKITQILYNYFKSYFNNKYDIEIHGIPVELYVEDVNTTSISNGIYSLEKNDWIKFPVPVEEPDVDISQPLKSVVDEYNAVMNGTSTMNASDLINHMYMIRKLGLQSEGEYSVGNLVFKEFRNKGYLDKLKDLASEEISRNLSLEGVIRTMNESKLTDIKLDIEEYKRLENELLNVLDDPEMAGIIEGEMDEIRSRIPNFDYWYNELSESSAKEYDYEDDSIDEALHGKNQIDYALQLAQEIGIDTLADLRDFLRNEAQPGEDELDTLSRYRHRVLGRDFKIKNEGFDHHDPDSKEPDGSEPDPSFGKFDKSVDELNKSLLRSKGSLKSGRVDEMKVNYTLPEDIAMSLRDAADEGYIPEVLSSLKSAYKAINDAGLIDSDDYQEYVDNIDIIDYDDELSVEYELSEFFDLCDNLGVWVPTSSSYDESDHSSEDNNLADVSYDELLGYAKEILKK